MVHVPDGTTTILNSTRYSVFRLRVVEPTTTVPVFACNAIFGVPELTRTVNCLAFVLVGVRPRAISAFTPGADVKYRYARP